MRRLAGRLPGLPGAARRRLGLRGTVTAVVVAGVVVTAVLAVVTFRGHQRAESRLLALQTRLSAAAGQAADQLYVEDHLGAAATLAAATDGNRAQFRKAVASVVTATGPFVSAALWRLAGASPGLVAEVGRKQLMVPRSARLGRCCASRRKARPSWSPRSPLMAQ